MSLNQNKKRGNHLLREVKISRINPTHDDLSTSQQNQIQR